MAYFPCHFIRDGKCSCGKDCESPGKHPLPFDGLKAATNDKAQHAKWWKANPQANLATLTGEESGIVVVDIDKDKGGFDTLSEIEEQYGRFPETWEVRTGGGGIHLYFRYPAGEQIGSRNGWKKGIDIKADGGYVLAPPSNHVQGIYQWEAGCSPRDRELADVPGWLLPLLPRKEEKPAEPKAEPKAEARDNHTYTFNGNGHASLLHRARCYVDKAAIASEGTRNATAFRLAGHLAAIDEYGTRLSERDILDLLRTWNDRCNPPLDDSELQSCVASAMTNGKPRQPKEAAASSKTEQQSPGTTEGAATHPEIIRLCDVQPEAIEWLWPGRIAIGKITLLAGNPGLGKSFVTLDIAARVSRGGAWPDNQWEPQAVGGVVLLNAEDDLGDTIRPRLDSHLADVSKVIALQGIRGKDGDGEYKRGVDLARDIDQLRTAIAAVESCRLVIVDPVSAYMGKTDSHKNCEVRSVLAPLAELAAETRVAILAVSHLRKGEGAAIYRTMGSLAFVAAARAVWIVTEDTADPHRRLFLPAKNNLSNDITGLGFAIESLGPDTSPIVTWEAEPVHLTAEEAMSQKAQRGRPADARDAAAEWLRQQLASGPKPATSVLSDGEAEGFSGRTLHRALNSIGGKKEKRGFSGGWLWLLPEAATEGANDT